MPNLILVHQNTKQALSDLETIAHNVASAGAGIEAHVVDTKTLDWSHAAKVANDATLTVSPMPIKKFAAPRGRVCQGFEYRKCVQNERLRAIGVPVPDWIEIGADTTLDPEQWGPYVVVKPELGRKGAEIRIKRTERVRFKPEDSFPEGHPGRKAPHFAQRFIYTGPWPSNFRVVTLFGKTLMCWRCEADHGYPALESRYGFDGGGVTIVSNKKTSHYSLAFDEDVMRLAEKAHAAFPDQPLLGTDVIRDAETGELFVLETNPRGDTWYMSSATGEMIQRDNGVDFMAQFNALEIASEVLVRKTIELAS